MATSFVFGGKVIQEPGAYSTISSVKGSQVQNISSGSVLFIDNGIGAGYGGAGISGTNLSGKNAIYEFTELSDFRNFIRGGELLDIAEELFQPYGTQVPGISKLYFVSAKASTQSTITLALTAGTNGGTVVFDTVEGVGSAGVEDAGELKIGFAVTMHAGTFDTSKFVFKFWRGSWGGLYSDGTPNTGVTRANAKPILVAETEEISNVSELEAFANGDYNFLKYFKLTSSTPVLTGAIDALDLTALGGSNVLSTGGTETYSSAVQDLDYSIVLSDREGANSGGAENLKIANHLATEARFTKFLFVGGSANSTNFVTQSITPAIAFDSIHCHVVHGGILKNLTYAPSGVREYTALHKAAYFVGRMAGLDPQIPMTFKIMNYDGEVHEMTSAERKFATKSGVITTKYDPDFPGNIVLNSINTLQNNTSILNADGSSYSIQAMRIISQLNKIIEVQSKLSLLGDQTGANPATKANLSNQSVRLWTAALLTRYEGTLITSFQNIVVSREQDAIFINYEVSLNSEITKLFFGGTIINI